MRRSPRFVALACKGLMPSKRLACASKSAERLRRSRQSAPIPSTFGKPKRRAFRARASKIPTSPQCCASASQKALAIAVSSLPAGRSLRETFPRVFAARVFGTPDAVILPVMPVRVPLAPEADPPSDKFFPATLYALSRFTRFVNFLGFPAVAIPAGFDDRNLPVAIQIVGRSHGDRALLALAQAVQDRTDWHARVPAAIADVMEL